MAENIRFTKNIKTKTITVEHWLVNDGDAVKKNQQLLTITANNKVYVIRSPIEGILFKKNFHNGETLNVNESLGEIITPEEARDIRIRKKLTEEDLRIIKSFQNGPTSKVKKAVHVKATPSARQTAKEKNVNLEDVNGTGPEGRIQAKDVLNYIEAQKQREKRKTLKKEKKVLYGLPLTALASRLAKKYKLDVSKIPAPPDATKIKKKDVERYLRNPKGAEDEIEHLYNIYNLAKLNIPVIAYDNLLNGATLDTSILPAPEEVQSVIALATEEPSYIPSSKPIELDQKYKSEREKLDVPVYLLLDEPPINDNSVIRLFTDEPLILAQESPIELEQRPRAVIPQLTHNTPEFFLNLPSEVSDTIIRLGTEEYSNSSDHSVIILDDKTVPQERFQRPIEILLLEEPPEDLEQTIIRLPSEVGSSSVGDNIIIMVPEEMKPSLPLDQNYIQVSQLNSRKAVLSTLVNLDLLDLIKKYNPPVTEIGNFAKNYILTTILKTFKESLGDKIKEALYVSDILEDKYSLFKSTNLELAGKEIKKSIRSKGSLTLDDGDIVIVDLLPYSIDNVEELIDSENRIVIYLSYLKQLERFFTSEVDINSILKVTLNFDTTALDIKNAIEIVDELRNNLESLEANDEQ